MEDTIHPAAEVFPMFSEDELNDLAADIKKNGQTSPIQVCNGVVIDGRNRLAACKIAGVQPVMEEVSVDNPFAYVVSANIKRRHMTTQQRAAIAAELANLEHGSNQHREKKEELPNL